MNDEYDILAGFNMSVKNKRCPCGSGRKYKNCCGEYAESNKRPNIEDKLKNARLFYESGLLTEAQALYEKVLEAYPKNKFALFELSLVVAARRDYDRAEALLKNAIEVEPNNHIYYSNLGYMLQELGRPVEAAVSLGKSISLKPDFADAYLNRANAYATQGRIDDAINDYKAVLRLAPTSIHAKANLAYTMNFSPSVSEEEVYESHIDHARALEAVASPVKSFAVEVDINRKLKIGYLSSDFRRHSVAYFVKPVLEHHDRSAFQVFGYYNHEIIDETTNSMMEACDNWRNISKLNDYDVVRQIQNDGIDILIDLNGCTAHNRLGVMARKPAPVQCEWLGYPNTTGLGAVDYWICDEVVNPPGMTDQFYSERLLRLSGCFICFDPPMDGPDPTDAPFERNGYITFGSFNNYAKVSEQLLGLWRELLKQVPHSRLFIKSACLGHESQRRSVMEFFVDGGIEAGRIRLQGYEESRLAHIEMYSGVDIALDSFPYNGTTTTCEAMWMGVPVVSMAGVAHRSRVGKTLLDAVGLDCLVADSPEEYIRIAAGLSGDTVQLSYLRSHLRNMMLNSRLTDGRQFTQSLEAGFRNIWADWCDRQT